MKKRFLNLVSQLGYLTDGSDELDKSTIDFYIKLALKFVKWYVHRQDWDEDDYEEEFEYEIANIAAYMYGYSINNSKGIKQKIQGSRSITFQDYVIPETYYDKLPRYPHIF